MGFKGAFNVKVLTLGLFSSRWWTPRLLTGLDQSSGTGSISGWRGFPVWWRLLPVQPVRIQSSESRKDLQVWTRTVSQRHPGKWEWDVTNVKQTLSAGLSAKFKNNWFSTHQLPPSTIKSSFDEVKNQFWSSSGLQSGPSEICSIFSGCHEQFVHLGAAVFLLDYWCYVSETKFFEGFKDFPKTHFCAVGFSPEPSWVSVFRHVYIRFCVQIKEVCVCVLMLICYIMKTIFQTNGLVGIHCSLWGPMPGSHGYRCHFWVGGWVWFKSNVGIRFRLGLG